ncbi:MAG: hypothetical protein ACM3VZ_11510 [Acidobacteriota bacterium]
MTKNEAIKQLGRTATEAAAAIGITAQALSQWPEVLPQRLIDRVQAALWRKAASRKPRKQKAGS